MPIRIQRKRTKGWRKPANINSKLPNEPDMEAIRKLTYELTKKKLWR